MKGFETKLYGIGGLALALRLIAAARPIDVVDRWFIPDDTYYVLAIARSMAEGLGPTVNGEVLTSGFQPLIAFLLVPVFALTTDPELPIRAALVFLGSCDAVNAMLLGWLVKEWKGPAAGLVAAGLWAISPIALENALGGLETALALTALLTTLALWTRHRWRPSLGSALLLGLAVGLALLARVDAVFLVALLGLVELAGRGRKHLLAIVPAAVAVVAPWWGYCLWRFGTVIPDSGAAAREVALAYQGDSLNALSETIWAVWTILGPPFVELRGLRSSLYLLATHSTAAAWVSCLAALVLLGALIGSMTIAVFGELDRRHRAPFLVFVGHGVMIAAFYAYYVPVLWFFRRYTSPTALVMTALISAAVVWAWRARTRQPARLALALVALGLAAACLETGRRLVAPAAIESGHAVDGPTGYRAPTLELLAKLPDGAVVAGLQSGATSYFAPDRVTVHNADGVVDKEAARAFKDGEVGRLFRDRGVTHFLDWPLQHDMLLERAGAVGFALEPVGSASTRQQSGHRLRLSQVRWAGASSGQSRP